MKLSDSAVSVDSRVRSTFGVRSRDSELSRVTFADVLSDRETRGFLTRYFPEDDSEISLPQFVEALIQEHPLVFEGITEEERIEFFRSVASKVTTDPQQTQVSVNALELLTRAVGLRAAVSQILEEVRQTVQNNSRVALNETLINEVFAIREMLEKKAAALKGEEERLREIAARERQTMMLALERAAKEFAIAAEDKVSGRTSELARRVTMLEKELREKTRTAFASIRESKSLKENLALTESKYKAKAAQAEKSAEFLKTKNTDLEKKLAAEREEKTALAAKNEELKKKLKAAEEKVKAEKEKLTSVVLSPPLKSISQQEKVLSPPAPEIHAFNAPPKSKVNLDVLTPQRSDQIEVLLDLLSKSFECLRTNLEGRAFPKANIGELLAPSLDNFISSVIELTPLLKSTEIDIKHRSFLAKLLYQLAIQKFPSKAVKPSSKPIKMLLEESSYLDDMERSSDSFKFIPQSELWKKVQEGGKPQKKAKKGFHTFSLINDEVIEKELVVILREALQSLESKKEGRMNTESFLERVKSSKTKGASKIEVHERSKEQLELRFMLAGTLLILANEDKDQMIGWQVIRGDLSEVLNTHNEAYMKECLIHNQVVSLCIFYAETITWNRGLLDHVLGTLLMLASNGPHYKDFINQLSQSSRVEVLLKLFTASFENNEIIERLSILLQRLSYHDQLTGKIPQHYIEVLREKIKQLNDSMSFEFIVSNLRATLVNLGENDEL